MSIDHEAVHNVGVLLVGMTNLAVQVEVVSHTPGCNSHAKG